MTDRHQTREEHPHRHGPGCGHTSIRHEGHVDYVHDGHLHHQEEDRVEEHRIAVSERNPDRCTPEHECSHHAGHPHEEPHAEEESHHHPMVPHGDHMDAIHEGRLHHHHGDHCDDHGPVEVVQQGESVAPE